MKPGWPDGERHGALNNTAAARYSRLLENRPLATDSTGLADPSRSAVKQAVIPNGGYHRFSTVARRVRMALTKDGRMTYETKGVIIQHFQQCVVIALIV